MTFIKIAKRKVRSVRDLAGLLRAAGYNGMANSLGRKFFSPEIAFEVYFGTHFRTRLSIRKQDS